MFKVATQKKATDDKKAEAQEAAYMDKTWVPFVNDFQKRHKKGLLFCLCFSFSLSLPPSFSLSLYNMNVYVSVASLLYHLFTMIDSLF